jgi:hypothetical protein
MWLVLTKKHWMYRTHTDSIVRLPSTYRLQSPSAYDTMVVVAL